jgi:hypothetical protein
LNALENRVMSSEVWGMSRPKGKVIPLSVGRKLVEEVLYHARQVPSLPTSRDCRIPALVAARNQAIPPPSWMAIFLKAFASTARKHPELRRAWLPYPYRRIYEHPYSECSVLIEREWEGEPTVLIGRLRAPENMPLTLIHDHLRRFQTDDVWSVPHFRQYLRLGYLPRLFRRYAFWVSLYFSGAKRAKRFGTYSISSIGSLGAEQIHPITPLTTYFTFGPISAAGEVTVKFIYDHRVMDDRTVARALISLEEILNSELLAELRNPLHLAA